MLLVYRYRIKSLTALLGRQARACNFVWNFCNETQQHALKWNKRWPSGFDLNRLTAGSSKELALHAGSVNAVCEQYAKSRRQENRPFLRWRGRRSLGWVPLKGRDLKREGEAFRFAGNTFRVFHSRPLPDGKIKDGTNFSCDAHGAWYEEVNESFSSRVCSSCASETGPKGVADLGIRSWVCAECGISHDRDINSALNILFRSGHRTPAEGIQAL